jgi:hypothetical protein
MDYVSAVSSTKQLPRVYTANRIAKWQPSEDQVEMLDFVFGKKGQTMKDINVITEILEDCITKSLQNG